MHTRNHRLSLDSPATGAAGAPNPGSKRRQDRRKEAVIPITVVEARHFVWAQGGAVVDASCDIKLSCDTILSE